MGYRDPPKANQFKPGQSGNPSGRPKARVALGDLLRTELERIVPRSSEEGRQRTKQEVLAERLVDAAVGGNLRAVTILSALLASGLAPAEAAPEISEADKSLLGAFTTPAKKDG